MGNDRVSRQQELGRLLLAKARQDLEAAAGLSGIATMADEVIGFHAQQSIEKAIKAALTRLGVSYEFTHDLLTLFEQAEQSRLHPPTKSDSVGELTPFAVQFRYSLYEDPEPFDRPQAIKLAELYVNWAQGVVETPVTGNATIL